MMGLLVPAIVVGVGLTIAAIIYAAHVAEKKRIEQLQQVAQELGFEFQTVGDASLLTSLNRFHLFSQGHTKKQSNVMRGKTNELEVTIFDYRYTTGSGKHSHTWNHTVICFRFDGPPLPEFSLRPENFAHKIGAWFGYQDIDFEDDPSFSRKYLLRGSSEAAVRELFTDKVRRHFDEKSGLSVEASGDTLVFYRHAVRVKPEAIRSLMEDGFSVFGLLRQSA
jgi:hypothetical protein